MSEKDWFCEECNADFKWLIWVNEDEFGINQHLKKPETKEEWKEVELFTNLGMFKNEFYPVGENGCEIDQELCKKCLKAVKKK